jgi:hypothetical protein
MFSGLLAEQDPPSSDVDALRQKIADLEERARIQAKHGRVLTDEQYLALKEEECRRARAKQDQKERVELERAAEERKQKEILKLAFDMVQDGRIHISMNDERFTAIKKDLAVSCPHCGHPIISPGLGPIHQIAKMWHETSPSDRFSGNSPFIIRDARNVLSDYHGIIAWSGKTNCENCGQRAQVRVQLVMI